MSIKQKWIEALRSGKYKQGKHVLRNKYNEFCCLGVLGHLCGGTWELVDTDCYTFECNEYKSTSFFWPKQGHAGIGAQLAKMNDRGCSFSEIADWIEENVPDDLIYKEDE